MFVSSLTLNVLFLTISSFVNFTFPSTIVAGNFFQALSHFPYFTASLSPHVSLTGALCWVSSACLWLQTHPSSSTARQPNGHQHTSLCGPCVQGTDLPRYQLSLWLDYVYQFLRLSVRLVNSTYFKSNWGLNEKDYKAFSTLFSWKQLLNKYAFTC